MQGTRRIRTAEGYVDKRGLMVVMVLIVLMVMVLVTVMAASCGDCYCR